MPARERAYTKGGKEGGVPARERVYRRGKMRGGHERWEVWGDGGRWREMARDAGRWRACSRGRAASHIGRRDGLIGGAVGVCAGRSMPRLGVAPKEEPTHPWTMCHQIESQRRPNQARWGDLGRSGEIWGDDAPGGCRVARGRGRRGSSGWPSTCERPADVRHAQVSRGGCFWGGGFGACVVFRSVCGLEERVRL